MHRLWLHVLFLMSQGQPCFPSSPKSTSRKRSSRAEQSRGIQPHSRTLAIRCFHSAEKFPPNGKIHLANRRRKALRPPPPHHLPPVRPPPPNQFRPGIQNSCYN